MDTHRAPRQPVDARGMRFEHGVVAVAILAGFVFRIPWVLPALAAILVTAAFGGPRLNLLLRIYDALLARRMGAPVLLEDGDEARIADLIRVGMLVAATVALLVDLGGIAWIIALVQAFVSALRAAAGIHLGVGVYDRFRRRG